MKLTKRTTRKQRARLAQAFALLHEHAALIDYVEERPFKLYTWNELMAIFAKGEHVRYDCSGMIVQAFFMSGLADPSGQNFSGEGNTESMRTFLPNYPKISRGNIGALLEFVGGPLEHVCGVWTPNGDNPTLFSNGSEPGPLEITYNDEKTAHVGQPVVMLDISKLGKR